MRSFIHLTKFQSQLWFRSLAWDTGGKLKVKYIDFKYVACETLIFKKFFTRHQAHAKSRLGVRLHGRAARMGPNGVEALRSIGSACSHCDNRLPSRLSIGCFVFYELEKEGVVAAAA